MIYLRASLLILLVWILAVFAAILAPVLLWINPREYLRALDQLGNAAFFRGYGRESMSSHAARDQIRLIIWITTLLDNPKHCSEANRHEQPIIDFINHGRQA